MESSDFSFYLVSNSHELHVSAARYTDGLKDIEPDQVCCDHPQTEAQFLLGILPF